MKSRVLLVDDSPSALLALRKIVSSHPELVVVGEAKTRAEALSLSQELLQDLITMDVYLGGHDGGEVASAILRSVPTRVVMVTGLDQAKAEIEFRAFAVGEMDVLRNPSMAADQFFEHQRGRFLAALVGLSKVKVVTRRPHPSASTEPSSGIRLGAKLDLQLFVLGSSTGGPPLLFNLLKSLPRPFPAPIVIVQHIEPAFAEPFADWLNNTGHVCSVVRGVVEPEAGRVYVAPGNAHLRMNASGLLVESPGEVRGFQLPSIDEFLESLASHRVHRVFACLLTGMGSDGAEG